jgi:hypothetical protein
VASVVALALAGYIGSVLGPHFKGSSTPTTTTATTLAPAATTSTVAHASVKVVVANGTQMANTAGHFTQLLQQQGWNVGSPQNSTTSATTTTIYYAPSKQPSAAIIASEIGAPAAGRIHTGGEHRRCRRGGGHRGRPGRAGVPGHDRRRLIDQTEV